MSLLPTSLMCCSIHGDDNIYNRFEHEGNCSVNKGLTHCGTASDLTAASKDMTTYTTDFEHKGFHRNWVLQTRDSKNVSLLPYLKSVVEHRYYHVVYTWVSLASFPGCIRP